MMLTVMMILIINCLLMIFSMLIVVMLMTTMTMILINIINDWDGHLDDLLLAAELVDEHILPVVNFCQRHVQLPVHLITIII